MAVEENGLRLLIEASTKQFEKALSAALKQTDTVSSAIEARTNEMIKTMESNIGSSMDGINDTLKNFGIGFGAAFSTELITRQLSSLKDAVKSANDEILAIGKSSLTTGISTEQTSILRNVGKSNGIGTDATLATLKGVAEKLNEANNEENSLTKLLEANNIQYRDRNGIMISTNQTLEIAADLIRRAYNEFDKQKIADALGVSQEWIKVLEQGPEAFRQAQNEARTLGGLVTSEMVNKATEFDKQWNNAWAAWSVYTRSALLSTIETIRSAISLAKELSAQAPEANTNGADGKTRSQRARDINAAIREEMNSRYGTVENNNSSIAVARKNEIAYSNSQQELLRAPLPSSRPTDLPAEENAKEASRKAERDAFEEFFLNQTKKNDLIRAEQGTIGFTTEARIRERAQVELNAEAEKIARQRGSELTAEEKAKVEQLIETRASEGQRLETLKGQYNDMLALQRASGQLLSGFMSDIISGGKNAEQAIMNLTKRLADMVLQAAILGDGPLAGIMGTKSNIQGGVGGLIGGLFGGLGGGSVGSNATLASGFGLFSSGGFTGQGATTGVAGLVHGQEFVINAEATKRYFPLLEAINAKRLPGYSAGGFVGNRSSEMGGFGSNMVVNITNNSKAQMSQKETETAGGRTIDVVIEDVFVDKAKNRGSATFGVLQQLGGVKQPLIRR